MNDQERNQLISNELHRLITNGAITIYTDDHNIHSQSEIETAEQQNNITIAEIISVYLGAQRISRITFPTPARQSPITVTPTILQ